MNCAEYLDRLLLKYSNSFNIYMPYNIGLKEYPAYGYFFSHNEKYVLTTDANMWTADSYEHIIFLIEDRITERTVEEAKHLISDYMEPDLVRKGAKYPDSNHMSSILTIILISQQAVDEQVHKSIKKYKFDKGYQFHFKGFSYGRIGLISIDNQEIITCKRMKKDRKSVV